MKPDLMMRNDSAAPRFSMWHEVDAKLCATVPRAHAVQLCWSRAFENCMSKAKGKWGDRVSDRHDREKRSTEQAKKKAETSAYLARGA